MNNVLKVTDFSTETMEASRQWNHIFQASDMVSSWLLWLWGHFPVHPLGVFRSPFLYKCWLPCPDLSTFSPLLPWTSPLGGGHPPTASVITYVLKTLNHGSWFHLPKVRTMGPVSAHLPSSTRNSSRSTCGLPSGFPISRNGCPSHSAAQASIRGAGNSHLSHLAHLRWLFSGHNYYLQVSLHPEVSTNWGNFLYLCTSVLSFIILKVEPIPPILQMVS